MYNAVQYVIQEEETIQTKSRNKGAMVYAKRWESLSGTEFKKSERPQGPRGKTV